MAHIRTDIDALGVATLTLSRPEKHNALSVEMMDALSAAFSDLAANANVRVVVLAAEGETFCAGGDLRWMQQLAASGPEVRMAHALRLAQMLRDINTLPKPLIVRCHGNAFGAGAALLSVCDLVVASDTAKFGLTETRLGMVPATLAPFVVARMGEANARRVLMSSKVFDAAEAVALNLISKTVRSDELDAAIEAEVRPYLACAPSAVTAAKTLLRSLGPTIDDEVIRQSAQSFVDQCETDEAQEGLAAFFDKRKARWVP